MGFSAPTAVAADLIAGGTDPGLQKIYVADFGSNRVLRWGGDANDIPVAFAGQGSPGMSGDGGQATLAQLNGPSGVAVDFSGNVYVADSGNAVVRKIGTNGVIQTIAGVPGVVGNDGDGGLATLAHFVRPWALQYGNDNVLYVSDVGANTIRKIKGGKVYGVAGRGDSGDDNAVAALLGRLNQPTAISLIQPPPNDPNLGTDGEIFVADSGNHRIHELTCYDGSDCNGYEGYDRATSRCTAGTPPPIDDSNPCTADSCAPFTGLKHTNLPAGTACPDTSLCNGTETCDGQGHCNVPGTPLADDSNPCTTDFCNATTGAVSHTTLQPGSSCNDGNACNGTDTCDTTGHCAHSGGPVVDDGKFCTTDSCNPSTGAVTNTPTPGVACALGSCSNGVQIAPSVCNAQGDCSPGNTTSCGAFACGATACRTTCTSTAQCAANAFCDTTNSVCVPAVQVGGACGAAGPQCAVGTCVDGTCCDGTSSADPLANVAIKPDSPTDFVTQISALYSGASPAQILGTPGAIDPQRVAVIRGHVIAEAESAGVSCAKVSVVGAPELGSTRTRADGSFTIAVNGGGAVTLRVERTPYISADRQVDTIWNSYALAQDIRLISPGPATQVATDPSGATLAATMVTGDSETDGQGQRTAKLLFPTGVKATVEGEATPRTNFKVQVKEMTNIAKTGHDGMVASLPVSSAFTYAVSLSLEGAENRAVQLTKPVPVYVDNFLGMGNGQNVPVGYYDTNSAQWVASENGRVISVVGRDADGRALLDVDRTAGADNPTSNDMANVLGVDDEERAQLAATYCPGSGAGSCTPTSLWRFRTPHFSSWDCNWGSGPPAPGPANPNPSPPQPPCGGSSAGGSIIDCEQQGLRETAPIAGTPFQLFYSSARQAGGQKPLHIPLTQDTLPPNLQSVKLEVTVAGVPFSKEYDSPTPNMSYDFYWNGIDASGRQLHGAQPVETVVKYIYAGAYMGIARFGDLGDNFVVAASNGRFEATQTQKWDGFMESWDAQLSALGGWDIDVHHGYDPFSGTLHLGNGTDQLAPNMQAGFHSTYLEFGMATNGLAVGSDGSAYITDTSSEVIRRLALDGTMSIVAGGGSAPQPPYGDGGPATSASLSGPRALAMGPGDKLYIADTGHHLVRVVDLKQHTISTIAGAGPSAPDSDGPATAVHVLPEALAVTPDGTLYIAQYLSSIFTRAVVRVRDGQLTVMPGGGRDSIGIAVDKSGAVYHDYDVAGLARLVAKFDTNGQHSLVTTWGTCPFGRGEGHPASSACIHFDVPETGFVAMTVGPDGLLYFAEKASGIISRINAEGNLETVAGTGSTNTDGADWPASAPNRA